MISGRSAGKTGRYWPITIGGYLLQLSVVPLLALAGSWQVAALLIVLERVGRAIRNPPRDAMLSHAAKEMGYGWGFGLHERSTSSAPCSARWRSRWCWRSPSTTTSSPSPHWRCQP